VAAENEDFMESVVQSDDTTKDLYLSFIVGDEEYAIEIVHVKEIVKIQAITVVPETPDYVKGIINLRGDIMPVLDVRTRFMKPGIPYDENTSIIVIYHDDSILGLIVDRVVGVYPIPGEQITPPPSAKLVHSNMYVKNIGRESDGLKLLIDLEKILVQ